MCCSVQNSAEIQLNERVAIIKEKENQTDSKKKKKKKRKLWHALQDNVTETRFSGWVRKTIYIDNIIKTKAE